MLRLKTKISSLASEHVPANLYEALSKAAVISPDEISDSSNNYQNVNVQPASTLQI